jgi:hypothetical protein
MEERQLNAFVRNVALRLETRRTSLAAWTALVASTAGGRYGSAPGIATARKKRKKKRCQGGTRRCGNRCLDVQSDRDNCGTCGNRCADGKSCYGGTCFTAAGSCAAIATCFGAGMVCGTFMGGICVCRYTRSGETRCGTAGPGSGGTAFCGECANDAACVARFGAGAFCLDCCDGTGACQVPCPV